MIQATTEDLRAKASSIRATADEVFQSQQTVVRKIADMKGFFRGTRPDDIMEHLLSLDGKYRAMYENLTQYADFLDNAATQYEGTEHVLTQEAAALAAAAGVVGAGIAGAGVATGGGGTSVSSGASGAGGVIYMTGSGAGDTASSNEKSIRTWDSIPDGEIELDSFNGIPSYVNRKNFDAARTGRYYDVGFENGEKNCAEYVKRYYKTLYGMNVTGLTPGGSPSGLIATSSPIPGDVIRTVVDGTVHWAIVKEVKDGMAVVIEQNTVYKSGSGYAVSVNNSYPVSGNRFYTLPQK
jgi:hypothetical protein